MKDEVKIYDKLEKVLLFLVFINVRTFSTKTYYFKETTRAGARFGGGGPEAKYFQNYSIEIFLQILSKCK